MPAAYSPEAPEVDQTMGPSATHTAPGSRFNELNSRIGATSPTANVTEAIAAFKSGDFTKEDLRQLAFAMGFQIVEGKDTAALTAQIAELQRQVAELHGRANLAEAAFAKANEKG